MTAGKILIFAGAVILGIGVLVQAGVPLFRLPGDIKISGENVTIYIPLVTGLVLSIALTILLNVVFRSR